MSALPQFDYQNPDYAEIWRKRAAMLKRVRAMSTWEIEALRKYYGGSGAGIADFISDWGVTMDPRNADTAIPVIMPFILFPKQREWVEFAYRKWKEKKPGITEKSRDIGISWLSMAFSAAVCLLHKNVVVGFGSAKEDNVDMSGNPSTLFYKGRAFVDNLPREFRGKWSSADKSCTSYKRLMFENGSAIVGSSGDNIGRGDRTSIFFVDEAAHLERPKLIDASLSATTDCRMDMSSVNGMANSFAERRHSGAIEVFTFNWRSDPRRNEEWAKRKEAQLDPVVWAAEYEIDYTSSVEGIIIPSKWVRAAIGLAAKLAATPSGIQIAALDVADEGRDKNAFAVRHGAHLLGVTAWSGKGSDLNATTGTAFRMCDDRGLREFIYDADGMGAAVRGQANTLNIIRGARGSTVRPLVVVPFRGSGSPAYPTRKVSKTERTNEDYFLNAKAQGWYHLRTLFENAWLASEGRPYDAENIIYLPTLETMPDLMKLVGELSQPVWKPTASGKLMVDKTPDGMSSPNYADACMMVFAPRRMGLNFTDDAASV